jgi:hypothetical protein
MYVRHTVKDYASWRKVYDEFNAVREGMGEKGDAVYQAVDNPNDVTVWHDFDSLEEARALVASSELREAMEKAGVASQPDIWFTNPV